MSDKKISLFNKPAKGKIGALALIFLWILIWNVIYQGLHEALMTGPVKIISWAFFISATVFFMQEELGYLERFFHTLIGGAIGLLLAAALIACCKLLMGLGFSHFLAICIPLAIILFILIVLEPFVPMAFNNVGFCYFIVSLIKTEETVAELPNLLLSLLAGCVILVLGCVGVLELYKKLVKKSMQKRAAQN